jgi:hypothetical protein
LLDDLKPVGIFEYISVLTSIIIGLGIAHLLRGMAGLVQHPGRHKLYWVHLVWVGYMFFNMVFWWWWEFNLGKLEVWYFPNYLFVLIYAVLLYLCCALLFPSDLTGYSGFEDFFISRRVWFFGLLAFTNVIDVYDTWMKGAEHFANAGNEYLVLTGFNFIASVIAAVTPNRIYHACLAIAAISYQVQWALSFSYVMG